MTRRRTATKREVLPDAMYGDIVVTKFMNSIMQDGKKSVAERIVYGAFDIIQKRTGKDPLEIFHEALNNIRPSVEVKSRRVGGATYQVPVEVRPIRQAALSLRWVVSISSQRSEKTMTEKIANELLEASQNRGGSIKKREDTHKMAEANKAFSHYRW